MSKAKMSVIIAAKNEAPRIGEVLKIVTHHPDIDQVIVMDDKSDDNTHKVAESYGAEVHKTQKENHGKTMAVHAGLEFAKNDIILLLDADLVGLTSKGIDDLASPVLENKVDFTLSLRKNSTLTYKLAGIDFVSGERVIKKELLLDPAIWSKPEIGFSLEVLMNKSLISKMKKFVCIPLKDLRIIKKRDKVGLIKGVTGEFSMITNIFRALPFYEVGWQFLKMAYLNKKYQNELNISKR